MDKVQPYEDIYKTIIGIENCLTAFDGYILTDISLNNNILSITQDNFIRKQMGMSSEHTYCFKDCDLSDLNNVKSYFYKVILCMIRKFNLKESVDFYLRF